MLRFSVSSTFFLILLAYSSPIAKTNNAAANGGARRNGNGGNGQQQGARNSATNGGNVNLAALTNTGPQSTNLVVNNPPGLTTTSNALSSGGQPSSQPNFGPLPNGLPPVSQLVAQSSTLLGVPVQPGVLPINPMATPPQNVINTANINNPKPGSGVTPANLVQIGGQAQGSNSLPVQGVQTQGQVTQGQVTQGQVSQSQVAQGQVPLPQQNAVVPNGQNAGVQLNGFALCTNPLGC